MLTNITENQTPPVEVIPDYEPPLPPTDLIFDDGEPLESNRHRIAMNALIRSLQQAWSDRQDYFTGGNMFIYYSSQQVRNKSFRGPDFFAVLNVDGNKSRQGWVVWEEEGRYPDVIIELMSPSTKNVDLVDKKNLYQNTFRTRDYFVYDPFDSNSLQGWHLNGNLCYQPLTTNEQGWLWCESLGFWLGTWQGTIDRETAPWLRFYDQQGNLVLLPEEAAQQQAELAQQQAELAQQQAESERERAEQAEQARTEAIPKLLQMGLSVEQIAQALGLTVAQVQAAAEKLA
jgi:Uma2 family endonuclease